MRVVLRSLFCLTTLAGAAAAQRDALVVSSAWLASHLRDPNLVVLHVGDRAEYQKTHIPGARFVELDAISISDHSGKGLMLEMPPAEKLRAGLASLGISTDSRVVVYYGKDWVTPATRVLFTLDYAGFGARSSLLDGGMPAWIRGGNQVTDAATPTKAGDLSALTLRPIVVDAEYVRSRLGKPGVSIVDGRNGSYYDGVQTGGGHDVPHKTGHIASAKSVPFTEIADAQLILKTPEQLSALFSKAGIARGDTIIGYCHIGQQATGMLFAARTLGFPVLLYDGSFEDWSARNLPVEAAKKP